ncbi:unnamed protein product [Caenorhabditis sp. 36 PRJEB53466]|nr:unnamed protein product [Caenorhabditis sp. 36 PRJEB53466]
MEGNSGLDSSFNSPVDSGIGGTTTNGSTTHFVRSTSRSTDGTDSTDGANSDNVTGSTGSTPAHHSIATNLNMALSQHTGDLSSANPFPHFNQADLLNFHQNSLLPHHMFSQFGRYPQPCQPTSPRSTDPEFVTNDDVVVVASCS